MTLAKYTYIPYKNPVINESMFCLIQQEKEKKELEKRS